MKPLNILSLFDGISCAQIALERAGFKVANYFASEIEKNSIKITQHNYPNTIQLGDVTKIKAADLPQIDLLVGGSPCQGFSTIGKGLNFEDSRSKLFFEYVRLLKECKPEYFLLENVSMKQEYQDIISSNVGVQPIKINSQLLSAQCRTRVYWTDIPNIRLPKNLNIIIEHILDHEGLFQYLSDVETRVREYKSNYLYYDAVSPLFFNQWRRAAYFCCKFPALTCGDTEKILCKDGRIRKTTILEQERLQTVPDNYTSCVCNTARHKALGNGFTVDIIAHILGYIKSDNHINIVEQALQLKSSDFEDLLI